MRQIARWSQNCQLEIRFYCAESTKLLDRCDRSFFAPYEKCGLREPPECLTNIDVERTRDKSCGRMPRTALV